MKFGLMNGLAEATFEKIFSTMDGLENVLKATNILK